MQTVINTNHKKEQEWFHSLEPEMATGKQSSGQILLSGLLTHYLCFMLKGKWLGAGGEGDDRG